MYDLMERIETLDAGQPSSGPSGELPSWDHSEKAPIDLNQATDKGADSGVLAQSEHVFVEK